MRFPKHAFAVQTVFRRCLLVSFAVDRFTGSRLDSVFLVGDVPYRWHRLERRPSTSVTTPR